jgi:hypothetical protein
MEYSMAKALKLTLSAFFACYAAAAWAGNNLPAGGPEDLVRTILKDVAGAPINKEAYDQAVSLGKTPAEAAEIAGNKVKEIIKVPGKPFRVVFYNGKVIGLKLKTTFTPLRSSLVLAENSCTRTIGMKGEFVIPLVLRNLIAYWAVHPTKQGQPVLEWDSDDKKEKVKVSTAFLTRLIDENFEQSVASVPASGIEDAKVLSQTRASQEAFGWFECPQGKCDGLLPKNTEVLFWDENFETGNSQARMTRNNEPSFTQMTSRLQQLPLTVQGGRINFGRPAKTFGAFAQFLPPGITYQLQWTFRDKNLVEPDDELCQMKWDLDFTRIFTQFTKATESMEDPAKVGVASYPEYDFTAQDEQNLFFSSLFSNDEFEGENVRK